MMETPGKKDQIYLLMYEKDMAEVLYVLLTGAEYSANFKEKVLKVSKFPRSKGPFTPSVNTIAILFSPEWGCNPSYSIVFKENRIASVITEL